jgi:glucokinase
VYVAGGLCRNLGPLLDVPALTNAFQAKGRFASYLAKVPIFQVMRPQTGLLGAAHFQHDLPGA